MPPDNIQQLHVRQPSTYEKPEAACAVLGSWWWACVARNMLSIIYIKIKFWYTVASRWIFHCKNCTMMHESTNIKYRPFSSGYYSLNISAAKCKHYFFNIIKSTLLLTFTDYSTISFLPSWIHVKWGTEVLEFSLSTMLASNSIRSWQNVYWTTSCRQKVALATQ
jgi:hypothetical protein